MKSFQPIARSSALSFLLFIFALFLSVPAPVKAEVFSHGIQITLTDIYDNFLSNPPIEGTKEDWGFSCFIEGTEKAILFDTGGGLSGYNGQILIQNIDRLGIALDNLDLIVISHSHPDHLGGLNYILGKKSGIPVYFGNSFPESFGQYLPNGAIPVRVKESIEICKDVYSTGELKGWYEGSPKNEQSLILDTPEGLVVITGCAHPGIINVLKKTKEILNKNIYLVIGGFHMSSYGDNPINEIIQEFKSLGVKKCGPAHCTGDRAIALFKEAYGQDFIPMGVGKVIQLSTNPVMVREENDGQSDVSNRFKLDQNYPNPFNPFTTIKFTLAKTGKVTVDIYNVAGQKVDTIVNTVMNSGSHSVTWNASKFSAGIYFYTVKSGGSSMTMKMTLLR